MGYSKGVQVDSKPAGCCAAPHWRISRKDYTVPADEKDLGKVGMAAVASMRKNGKSDAQIAKLYPKKVGVAKTVKTKAKCCQPATWGVAHVEGGNGFLFQIKNKPKFCGALLACPMWKNCSEGGNGGPAYFIGAIGNMVLMKTGWALGFGQTEVETEYLTFKQVFNGEAASTGDLLQSIRSAGKK